MNNESPFAHRIARTPKNAAKPAPIAAPRDLPSETPPPAAQVPTAPAPAAQSPLRQAMLVLGAFVITTLVLMIFAVAWSIILKP